MINSLAWQPSNQFSCLVKPRSVLKPFGQILKLRSTLNQTDSLWWTFLCLFATFSLSSIEMVQSVSEATFIFVFSLPWPYQHWQTKTGSLYSSGVVCSCKMIRQLLTCFANIPTMYYFKIPRHTQSMIAYKILTSHFWKSQWKIALGERC